MSSLSFTVYNNSQVGACLPQELRGEPSAEGWHGLVISFDLPSAKNVLDYLDDRSDGAAVAP